MRLHGLVTGPENICINLILFLTFSAKLLIVSNCILSVRTFSLNPYHEFCLGQKELGVLRCCKNSISQSIDTIF